MRRLTAPVGRGQANHPADVAEVQRLLDAHQVSLGRLRWVRLDSRYGPLTAAAIEGFQRDVVGLHPPDGVVGPDGPTWRRLKLRDLQARHTSNASAEGAAAAGETRAPPSDPSDELSYLAKTLYGEAAAQNHTSKRMVAWVIRNRVQSGRWGRSYRTVVTARLQFTCWSEALDPKNYARIQHPAGVAWDDCLSVANEVIHSADKDNPIPGATHYYSPRAQSALHQLDPWHYKASPDFIAAPAQRVPNPPGVSDDDFRFYKNVR